VGGGVPAAVPPAPVLSRPAWYALRPARAGQVLWPKIQQYRHVVPWNPLGLTASCNFYDLAPRDGRDPLLLAAVLNAFPQVLAKQAAGRVRNEGVLKTEVADAARMWAVDPARFAPAGGERVRQAFLALLARAALPVPEECGREDRCELDRAVLVAAGIGEGRASELVDRLHEHLCESFLRERRLERRAVEARRGPAVRIGPSPGDEASSGAQGALVPEVG